MGLALTLDFIRRRWWLLVLPPVIAGAVAYNSFKSILPDYQATALLLVNPNQPSANQPPGSVQFQYTDVLAAERLAITYAELVVKRSIMNDVRRRLALPANNHFESKITVTPIRDTQLLRISAKNSDPNLATAIANTTAQAFVDEQTRQPDRPGSIIIAEQASIPTDPARPEALLDTALVVMLVSMAAVGGALVLEYRDDTLKTADDIQRFSGLGTLAMVRNAGSILGMLRPAISRLLGKRPATRQVLITTDAILGEDYRWLRTSVDLSSRDTYFKTVVITSPNRRDGKTTTCANLAAAFAMAGQRVIAVDTDLRQSSLHTMFDVPNSFGLSNLLSDDGVDPIRALTRTKFENLSVLPAGPKPPNPSELLSSRRMESLINSLRKQADYIFFDTPSVLSVTDASVLASRTEATILVVATGKTKARTISDAAEALEQAQSRVIGVVMNKTRHTRRSYHSYRLRRELAENQMAVALPAPEGLPAPRRTGSVQ